MKLYNTLTRKEETFEPGDGKTVRMYVCGPTVYDHLHIGNLRPVIVFDALRKYMEQYKGWEVIYIQNVTDVDEKLIEPAAQAGVGMEVLAEQHTDAYFDLMKRLGVEEPTHSPRASEHMEEMIDLIKTLIKKGVAYERGGDVYFRVDAFKDYGKLSGRRLEELEAGARVGVSEKKENPLDFTLWKSAKSGEPKWNSPWGEGSPGWHTECVVLSRRYGGETLDIHAGGNDLIFPHHENEIAQAESLSEKPFARFWLHNGMLMFNGEKMSKSLGNFAYAYEVLDKFGPEATRYFYLSRHYRKPLDYSERGLEDARKAVERVSTLIFDIEGEHLEAEEPTGKAGRRFLDTLGQFRDRYIEAMNSDLNTVEALATIQELVAEINRFRSAAEGLDRLALKEGITLIRELGHPLGLFQKKASAPRGLEDDLIGLLIQLRDELRNKKEFALADRIRDRLTELGITLKDTSQGTIWT
jgi:cysteinyl-tRNA synthetase